MALVFQLIVYQFDATCPYTMIPFVQVSKPKAPQQKLITK